MHTKRDYEKYLEEIGTGRIEQVVPETPMQRYHRDPFFHTLVQQMFNMLKDEEHGFTLGDLLDAARFANEKYAVYSKTFGRHRKD